MRIAISGSHRTGKSTLLAELSSRLPAYETVDEPYHSMEEEGYEFSHPPSLEDFAAQLERSLAELAQDGEDLLFDRCPLDFLAYIVAHEDADDFDFDEWLPRVERAVKTLDLVVFVPIEARDRITYARSDDVGASRALVDEKLRDLLLEDPYELGIEVLEVEGELEARTRAVLRRVRDGSVE